MRPKLKLCLHVQVATTATEDMETEVMVTETLVVRGVLEVVDTELEVTPQAATGRAGQF